jgi:hypothetical protein
MIRLAMAALIGSLVCGPEIVLAQSSLDSLSRFDAQKKTDSVVTQFLSANPGNGAKEVLAYIHRGESVAARFPQTSLTADLYKQIGDSYYMLNRIKHAKQWQTWYRKAIAVDASLEGGSPLGYRLREYDHIALRANCLCAVFLVYGSLFVVFLIRVIRNWHFFDPLSFLKRTAVLLALFVTVSALVFCLDAWAFAKAERTFMSGAAPTVDAALPHAIVKPATAFVQPVIPLSIIDSSAGRRAAMIFMLGFFPIALVAFYASFKRPYSRVLLCAAVIFTIASIWVHFFIQTGFDEAMAAKVTITKTRVVYRGEPEKLLMENPRKSLRANPDLLKSANPDLQEFLEKNFPRGIKDAGR